MTEKRKPTYDLDAFKETVNKPEKLAATTTSIKTAAELGFGRSEIVETIQTMRKEHFYKSMTSYAEHTQWQDVYHVPSPIGVLYIKFTANLITEFLLLSFKGKNND
ncbi:MAG: type II toxin-antitoxin system MqsR family toxin [Desulfobacterales bacterium]|nr:type II toxin-antitoxin system MqsR family toxin [Desulfobacterales bacterium]